VKYFTASYLSYADIDTSITGRKVVENNAIVVEILIDDSQLICISLNLIWQSVVGQQQPVTSSQ